MNERFDVTYYNPLIGQRVMLIEDVSEIEADAVVAKFGNKKDKSYFLPEVRKEKQEAA